MSNYMSGAEKAVLGVIFLGSGTVELISMTDGEPGEFVGNFIALVLAS